MESPKVGRRTWDRNGRRRFRAWRQFAPNGNRGGTWPSAKLATVSTPEPAPAANPCWVLHDGAAGNRRQALALADALGLPSREWRLQADPLTRWLAPRQWLGRSGGFGVEFEQALRDSKPDLVIGCGRLAALATRQARSRGIRAVQILDPRIDPAHWDLVIAPEHDRLQGPNVLTLLGSLNPVDEAWLAQARLQHPALAALPAPRTAVLLGGPTRVVNFNRGALEVLLAKLEYSLQRDGGSLVICGSRRTPPAWAPLLRERYASDGHRVWMDESDGENFYAGALAWADRIVVSPDSVNMISEACATALPVSVAEPGRATGRVRRFLDALLASGRIRALERDSGHPGSTPLRETARVAARVRERLNLR